MLKSSRTLPRTGGGMSPPRGNCFLNRNPRRDALWGNAVWHQALSRCSARARDGADRAWRAFGLVVALIAADSGLWRLAGLVARSAFVGVTGDLRRDIFRYLTGHARGYFAERPGGRRRRIDGLYRRG